MGRRLSCWLNGHAWSQAGKRIYSDLFGNHWRLRRCDKCGTTGRVLHRAWSDQ